MANLGKNFCFPSSINKPMSGGDDIENMSAVVERRYLTLLARLPCSLLVHESHGQLHHFADKHWIIGEHTREHLQSHPHSWKHTREHLQSHPYTLKNTPKNTYSHIHTLWTTHPRTSAVTSTHSPIRTNDTLWGKCIVGPSWSLWGTYWRTHPRTPAVTSTHSTPEYTCSHIHTLLRTHPRTPAVTSTLMTHTL